MKYSSIPTNKTPAVGSRRRALFRWSSGQTRPGLLFFGLGLFLGRSGLGFAFGRGLLGLEQGGGLRGGALGGLGGLQGGALGFGDQLAALGQELGLVGRAGDQDGDLDRDLRMEVDLDLVGAQRLDRLVELDLAALDLDALGVDGIGDVARR